MIREVLQITDASQSTHPEVRLGDIIGSINNNALVAKEGTNWQQFYQGAVQWFKTQADQTKNVKFFRCSPDHQVNITDGSETFPPIVLSGAETDAWLGT